MIKINNISYAINGKNILSNINLNIRRNKITVITGKNGSGKSTLIKIINKIIFPSKGSIKSDYSEPVPMLFQKPISLNKSLEDNFLLLSNIKKSKVNKSYFNLFNLNKLKKRKFQNLSEGEKQKVFISRFMSFEQDLIILDEPNQNLDLESEKSFFLSLSKMKNKTIVLTLHNLTYIKDFADYLVILDSGKIIFNDTIKKFTKK